VCYIGHASGEGEMKIGGDTGSLGGKERVHERVIRGGGIPSLERLYPTLCRGREGRAQCPC